MLKYRVVSRKNPIDKSVKFYAQQTPVAPVTLDELCQEISHSTTATEGDVALVLKEAVVHIINHLLNGRSVRLGDLGSFRTTISSKGAAEAKKFDPSNIRGVRCRWTRSSRIRRAFQLTDGRVKIMKE